jgi:molecular chaperone DnaJ
VPTVDGDKTLSVREGTQSGDRLRMRGYGVPTLNGRARGDQYVHIKCAWRLRPTHATLGLKWGCSALNGSPLQ